MKKEEFSHKIMMLRGALGFTQEEFARHIGVSKRSVSAWENGDVIPKKTVRIKLSVTCGLPVNEFLLDEEMTSAVMGPTNSRLDGEAFVNQIRSSIDSSRK